MFIIQISFHPVSHNRGQWHSTISEKRFTTRRTFSTIVAREINIANWSIDITINNWFAPLQNWIQRRVLSPFQGSDESGKVWHTRCKPIRKENINIQIYINFSKVTCTIWQHQLLWTDAATRSKVHNRYPLSTNTLELDRNQKATFRSVKHCQLRSRGHSICGLSPSRRIVSSGIQNTGFTGFTAVLPSRDRPAMPNSVWNGSTWNIDESVLHYVITLSVITLHNYTVITQRHYTTSFVSWTCNTGM